MKGPSHFLNNFGWIENPQNFTEERFKLWPYQEEVLDWWMGNPKSIILKARQLGISWLVMGFALWLANFHNSAQIVCISKDEKKAFRLIDKVRFMYMRLPVHLREKLISDNRGELRFENGSSITALPANPGNAVSFTASLVIIDEWAELEYAEEVYKALKPTIEGGSSTGRFIGISTGKAVGTFYHAMWKKAVAGENDFAAKFLPYELRPGRTAEWWEKEKADYISEVDFFTQYPRNEIEAFLAAGGCPFSIDDINWYLETYVTTPASREELVPEDNPHKAKVPTQFFDYDGMDFLRSGELFIWKLPQAGELYTVNMDPATGEDGRDYHATQVLKLSTLEQVAEFYTHIDIDIYTTISWELAKFYNMAEVVPERNNTGYTVINLLVNHMFYPFVYQHEDFEAAETRREAKEKRKKYGWPTSAPSKRLRDHTLIGAIRDHSPIIRSARFFDEAQAFVRQPDGSYGASGMAHDDLLTSFGMGYLVALERIGKPKKQGVRFRSVKKRAFRKERWS